MSNHTVAFIRSLANRFPGLAPALQEHIEDNFGEILPHVFFEDVTRYVFGQQSGGAAQEMNQRGELSELLSFIEEAYAHGDAEIRELISASFLEGLPRPGDPGSQIRSLVGPYLRSQLKAIG